MTKATNTPYTRASGIEILKSKPYLNDGSNRQNRKEQNKPFIGNGKQYPLTVVGQAKYLRTVQVIGNKRILHYVPLFVPKKQSA